MPPAEPGSTLPLGYWASLQASTQAQAGGDGSLLVWASGRGPLGPELLAAGLAWLRQRQPVLGWSLVQGRRGWSLAPPGPEGPPPLPLSWATLDEESPAAAQIPAIFAEPPGCAGEPPIRCLLLRGEGGAPRWELALSLHHAIADGGSACGAALELLRACAQCARGEGLPDPAPLPPPEPTERWIARPAVAPGPPPPAPEGAAPPWPLAAAPESGRGQLLDFTLAPAELAALRAESRQRGLSPSATVLAALLLEAAALVPGAWAEPNVAIDLRRRAAPPLPPEPLGCHVRMVPLRVPLAHPGELWEQAAACRDALLQALDSLGARGFLPARFHGGLLDAQVAATFAAVRERRTFAQGLSWTNLGQLAAPSGLAPLQLDGLRFGIDLHTGLMPALVSLLGLGEVGCGLLCWPEPLLPAVQAQGLVQGTLARLRHAL